MMKCFAAAVMTGMLMASSAGAADCSGCKPASAKAKALSGVNGQAFRFVLQGAPPPKPLPPIPLANIDFVATDVKTGKEVARVKTDKDGKFKLALPPGQYKLQSKSGLWSFQHTVVVKANSWQSLTANFRYSGAMPPVAPKK
jgi:hypothetical protein